MENKINIAELLRNCPQGMELDCTEFYGIVKFDGLNANTPYSIRISVMNDGEAMIHTLTEYGQTSVSPYNKCVIFPKGNTTWEGFVPPCNFKDGDIVVAEDSESFQLFLLEQLTRRRNDNTYDGNCYFGWNFQSNELFEKGNWSFDRLATEEEKHKLFDAIKDKRYKWNPETKTLEKLPKFKVGDKIRCKADPIFVFNITNITKDKYECGKSFVLRFANQDEYELVPNKFDITTLKPFESRVLVRSDNYNLWKPALFGFVNSGAFYVLGGNAYRQCIPYEGNEHLRGTTNDCDPFYKTWEKCQTKGNT